MNSFSSLSVLFSVFSLIALSSCAPSEQLPTIPQINATLCGPGIAQIQVGDGFLRILCGCTQTDETAGTVITAPHQLTCHVGDRNTQVDFLYIGTMLRHQVRFISNNTAESALSDPSNPNILIRVFSVTFSQAGNYGFMDNYSNLTGQIIVP